MKSKMTVSEKEICERNERRIAELEALPAPLSEKDRRSLATLRFQQKLAGLWIKHNR